MIKNHQIMEYCQDVINLFSKVKDPRQKKKCLHPLMDILFISLCTLLSNGEDYEDMAEYGRQKEEWLKTKLLLPNGIPSHDTFNRVFQLLEPEELKLCLGSDGRSLLSSISGHLINFDGKKIKGESPKSRGNKGLYILSAWVGDHKICIGQEKIQDKSNEIQAIPKLLNTIDIQGATVSIDAIGCQRKIAKQIVKKGGDYLLSVKKNQKHLYTEIAENFNHLGTAHFDEQWEYAHGRYEERECKILDAKAVLSPTTLEKWENLLHIVQVKASRTIKNVTSCETRYYISSDKCATATKMNDFVRGHWSIENHLHWHLDVTFKEDACRARKGNAAENLNIMRKVALHRLAQSKIKLSLKKRRFRASLNQKYLETLVPI